MIRLTAALLTGLVFTLSATAQPSVHPQSVEYEWPTDSLVKQKLERWQDQKFGMIIHWGLYAVPGIIESWALCSEDWIERDSSTRYEDFKTWYWGLQKDFNPVNFDPEKWAAAGKEAGMKYLVFTTKHHDGFCMFDTKQTDFKISAGPFKNNPKADVAKYVFDAFRKKDFMIGAYFSKPDWHSEYYWWPKYATADRNNNYDIRKHPWRWNQFKNYTSNQIGELMNNYGSMDILWLDGGWVRPKETVNEEVLSWGARIPDWSQDINMPSIATMARKAQPGLLIVDRTVHGPYENYQTPEQRIPAEKLDHPWESCMTLANNWGFVPRDKFKTAATVIHNLVEVVAKGGSLLLGIGPKPDGTLPEEAILRMKEIGSWLDKNGEAIYNTRTVDNYRDSLVYFTQNKKTGMRYAIANLKETKPEHISFAGKLGSGSATVIEKPLTIEWKGNAPKKNGAMKLLQTGQTVKWKQDGNKTIVSIPAAFWKNNLEIPALAFAFVPER